MIDRHFKNVAILCSFLLPWTWSCSDGGSGICPGNKDLVPNLVDDETDLDTFRVGSLSIEALNKVGVQAEVDTLVQAGFSDFIEYRVYVSDRAQYSAACEVYTSQPVKLKRCRKVDCGDGDQCPEGYTCLFGDCRPDWTECATSSECPGDMVCEAGYCMSPPCCTNPPCDPGVLEQCPEGFECAETKGYPLTVESVKVTGLKGGDVLLEPRENGSVDTKLVQGIAYEEGNRVTFEVSSDGDEWSFPAFSVALDAPDEVVMTRFGDISNPILEESPSLNLSVERDSPLWISWVPGNGDYMIFTLSPKAGTNTPYGKLRCVTFDDGCLMVPAAALGHLALDKATNFTMKLDRHINLIWSKKNDSGTEAAAIVDLSYSLEAVVGR